jgi:hypothetical protein
MDGVKVPTESKRSCSFSNEQGRCDDALGERGVELPITASLASNLASPTLLKWVSRRAKFKPNHGRQRL